MNVDSTVKPSKTHPKGLYLLFFTEMWERFGYYLLLGILFLYMTKPSGLGFTEHTANDIYGTFLALVYLTPFLGGLLADRIFGYRRTIIVGGALMAAGYLTLAIPGEQAFLIGLLLIIVGNGFFKPNISTLLGNLYNRPEYKHLKDKGYNIFYMGINVGAFICNFVAAYMRNGFGWGWAFGAAGVGMIIGLIIFAYGSGTAQELREADVVKPTTKEDVPLSQIFMTIFVPAIIFAFIGLYLPAMVGAGTFFGSASNDAFLFACVPVVSFYMFTYITASKEDKAPLGSLLYIFAVVIIFWAIFHQNGNVLTSWAEKNTNREIPQVLENSLKAMGVEKEFVEKVNGDSIMVMNGKDTVKVAEVATYLKNLPKDQHPKKGESLSLANTELFQSINPFFVVLLTPIVVAFFGFLNRRGLEPSTPSKIAWGLFITGLSTLVMVAAVQVSGMGASKVSVWWLFCTYAVITTGELFLSPMGLSLVSKLSPARLTAMMMGGWFLSTSIGNKLSGVLGHAPLEYVFWINCAGAMLSAFLLFLFVKQISKVLKDKTGAY
jgi:proton-dependent oligopeptide transporter, POT family